MTKERMTKDEALLKLALEALEAMNPYPASKEEQRNTAITAIKEALAQPPEERNFCSRCGKRAGKNVWDVHTCSLPEQEPVAFGSVTVRRLSQRFENHNDQYHFYPAGQSPYLDNVDECHTVYTTPPQRTWVGLTDEEVASIYMNHTDRPMYEQWKFARAIEAKLKQKNGYAEEKNLETRAGAT